MPNIREVANRINSVTSTQQLTQAMRIVAAIKLNKVQQQVLQMRAYAEKLSAMLRHVTASADQQLAQRYLEQRPTKNLLLLVMTSDRGLCGSFNTNVLKKAFSHIQESARVGASVRITIVPIGRKALTFFQKKEFKLLLDYVALSHRLNFEYVGPLAAWLTEAFLQHTYDQIFLVYNAFQSATIQVPIVEPLLPISKATVGSPKQEVTIEYIYEPSKAALLEMLVPRALAIQLYKALLESNAAEHGARMKTMSKATDNAKDLLKMLRLTYNRTRQAAITQEIAEIVAGADGLGG